LPCGLLTPVTANPRNKSFPTYNLLSPPAD
jgi:hypothetical protein